ncbi:MAG TPA: hypothetical protein VJN18_11240 [Polyangiaceae bacterium]|nr:hypothetical protein [Polyangiaceae bacterium]
MAANEVKERLAAACWVQAGSSGGEAINAIDANEIRYRSLVGFRQEIITTTDMNGLPVLILPLDRTFSRKECAVFACRHATCGPNAASRLPYPFLTAAPASVPQVFVQPILLEWLGPDLSAPTFFPFGIINGAIPTSPPLGSNLDLFDAIAVLLPLPAPDAGASGDFSVLVLKHPPLEGTATELEPELPADVDVFALLRAWFRADTFTTGGEGGNLTALVGRVGIEGNLEPDSTSYNAPAADPLLNNQLAIGPSSAILNSTMPASFWDFLASGTWTFYGVAYPTLLNDAQFLMWTATPDIQLRLEPSDSDGELSIIMKAAWAQSAMEYPDSDANVGQWTKIVVNQDVANGLQLTNTAAGVNAPAPTGIPPAPGTFDATLAVNGRPTFGGELVIAELLYWDFALTPAQQAEVEAYLLTRYGTPTPPPDPILALEPTAWFRADTFTQSAGQFQALTGRVGSEGNLVAQALTYALPAAQAAANNQLGLSYGTIANNNIVSNMPPGFWDFVQTENSFFGAVFLVPGAGIQCLFTTAADDVRVEIDSAGAEQAHMTWGAAGVDAGPFDFSFLPAQLGVKQYYISRQDSAEPQPITIDLTPADGQNGGSFTAPPPASVAATLQLGDTTAGAQLGELILLDLIFFDRALTNGEITVWDAYVVERYGAF